ncbi:GntP family permease [Ferrimonas marina]|uniref:Gluconate:H+ symporter, GntP family n=1 Tax=Ferrimonas marina TaxID=299255 RepID=A0A1M5XAP1_9GAMM|nr:SLC13 family permease [Ferrimonas marina]SHH96273.1 gluconate:H+ symporter, GntP family [Ferrimonas marina]
MADVSTLGALVALVLAIVLILKRVPPAYGMMLGALIGALVGGASLTDSVALMIGGAQGIVTAVMRILAAGVLAGVLIESGAATSIAETIVQKVGEARALLALAMATMILTAVGVFVDVAVITVSPIALAIARRTDLSKMAVLLAMIGGGKGGNIMSPNPNTIAASEAFDVPLTSLMAAGVVPGLIGMFAAYLLAKSLSQRGSKVAESEVIQIEQSALPGFGPAIVAPVVAIGLLALRPIAGIAVDPLIALPLGGLLGALAMGKAKSVNHFAVAGLTRMAPVAVMLLGTGALAGIIANSELRGDLIAVLEATGLPAYLLAPISGAVMSLATASTTAGTVVASNVFASTILEVGISALAGAAMLHAGATVLDHMPHGSFFHATGGSVHMDIKERLKLIPYESAVGLVIAILATLLYGVFGLLG